MTNLVSVLVGGSAAGVLAVLVAGWLGKEMIAARIKQTITAEFDRERERFASQLRWESARREKAALIADVLSSWIAVSHDRQKTSDVSAYLELQRKYWELSLWLDREPLRLLNNALTHQPGANHNEALAKVRSLLVDEKDDPITAAEIVHFALPIQSPATPA